MKRNNAKQSFTKRHKGCLYIYLVVKRILDIVISLVGMVFVLIFTIAFDIIRKVRHEDDGSLFYNQLRIGKNGKQFLLHKYRSMCMNADEALEKYLSENEEARKEYKKYKKLKNDPRITKFGKFIRGTSLDEFPQFINVLFGSMSIVGPRPYLHREIPDMGDNYEKIISVKPGLTGLCETTLYVENRVLNLCRGGA